MIDRSDSRSLLVSDILVLLDQGESMIFDLDGGKKSGSFVVDILYRKFQFSRRNSSL